MSVNLVGSNCCSLHTRPYTHAMQALLLLEAMTQWPPGVAAAGQPPLRALSPLRLWEPAAPHAAALSLAFQV